MLGPGFAILMLFSFVAVMGCQESTKPLGRDQRGGTILGDHASTDPTPPADQYSSDRREPASKPETSDSANVRVPGTADTETGSLSGVNKSPRSEQSASPDEMSQGNGNPSEIASPSPSAKPLSPQDRSDREGKKKRKH